MKNIYNTFKFSKVSTLLGKYKPQIMYIIFGGVTTLVNILAYVLFCVFLHVPNVLSTVIAWLVSVVVAYITNKIWVFESKSLKASVLIREIISFFFCRLATGGIDVFIMWLGVDIMSFNSILIKVIANVIVIVLNYAVSKIYIFKKEH